jgi:hypothetical protein
VTMDGEDTMRQRLYLAEATTRGFAVTAGD